MNKTIPEIIHRRVPTTRYEADPSEGLSAEQVAEYRENWLDQPRGGTSVQDNGRDRKEQMSVRIST